MRNEDTDIVFINDVIDHTRDLMNKIRTLAIRYDVHPYTTSHGLIKSSSLLSAGAATSIFNFADEFPTKIEAAHKVSELYKMELFEVINEVEFNDLKGEALH